MIGTMTRHNRIMEHIRGYLDTLGGRRELDPIPVPFDLERVHIYVYALEQIIVGVESHSLVLREKRVNCFNELSRISRKALSNSNALNWYEHSARAYVVALENYIAGEGVSESALSALKGAYDNRRRAIRQAP